MTVLTRAFRALREGRLPSAVAARMMPEALRLLIQESWLRATLKLREAPQRTHPSISLVGDFDASRDASILREALVATQAGESPLPTEIRSIEGMSGQKYRALINHIIRRHPDARYLEVGSWKGSTATAALWNNKAKALCIDNWSQFGGPEEVFFENMKLALSDRSQFRFMRSDFKNVDFASIGTFNIYLFDGPHAEQDQYDGVMLAQPALSPEFILIVDDWNWRRVRVGTLRALAAAGCRVHAAIEVRTSWDDSHAAAHGGVHGRDSDWHNGYFVAAVRRA